MVTLRPLSASSGTSGCASTGRRWKSLWPQGSRSVAIVCVMREACFALTHNSFSDHVQAQAADCN
eukprot:10237030-Alexandrium_andersonii.AAC.1